MIVDASLLRRARPENVVRLGRSLGLNLAGVDPAQAVSRVAHVIRMEFIRADRARVAERRAEQKEFGPEAQRQWEQLIQEMVG